ncbi:hypothetical protein BSY19_5361 (plasmid) [Bosea sp. RAC05]|nr:hypothetical protein BSY19_5361 [Bosea sp. RAC05]
MLIEQMREQIIDLVYPDGYRHADALKPVQERIEKAQHYLLDESAVAMAASVAFSKPSSILAALPWVRLPFETIFIEFANDELRRASAAAGSPNIQHPHGITRLVRSGYLLTMEGNSLKMDYVAAQAKPDGDIVVDLAPIQGFYRLSAADLPPAGIPPLTSADAEGRRGKARDQFKLVSTDPHEYAAAIELQSRYDWVPHPDMRRVAKSFATMASADKVEEIWQRQADEAYRLFMLAILPALILLNCKNAVQVEHVPAPAKLNKARAKKGRPPIRERFEIRMKLSPARQRAADAQSASGIRPSAASLVAGHFKVRSGGRIFWWNSHVRHGSSIDPIPQKSRIITA